MSTITTLTEAQRAARLSAIGASEAAAVLGLSPWQTPADVYWRKVADLAEDRPTEAMRTGVRLEPVIVQWAAERLGVEVSVDCGTVFHGELPLCASPDGLVVGRPEAVEAKTSAVRDEWGDEGTDQVPRHYLVQAHHQMAVLDVERVWMPVLLLSGFRAEWRLYCVERDAALAAVLLDRESTWWRDHVEARVPPSDAPPPLDLLRRLRRAPSSVVVVGDNGLRAWDEYDAARDAAKQAARASDEAKAAVLALLGVNAPAEAAELPDGRQITFLAQRSAPAVDTKRMRAEFPAAFDACVTQGEHRVLRIRKGDQR